MFDSTPNAVELFYLLCNSLLRFGTRSMREKLITKATPRNLTLSHIQRICSSRQVYYGLCKRACIRKWKMFMTPTCYTEGMHFTGLYTFLCVHCLNSRDGNEYKNKYSIIRSTKYSNVRPLCACFANTEFINVLFAVKLSYCCLFFLFI